jgi:hypothetical protein
MLPLKVNDNLDIVLAADENVVLGQAVMVDGSERVTVEKIDVNKLLSSDKVFFSQSNNRIYIRGNEHIETVPIGEISPISTVGKPSYIFGTYGVVPDGSLYMESPKFEVNAADLNLPRGFNMPGYTPGVPTGATIFEDGYYTGEVSPPEIFPDMNLTVKEGKIILADVPYTNGDPIFGWLEYDENGKLLEVYDVNTLLSYSRIDTDNPIIVRDSQEEEVNRFYKVTLDYNGEQKTRVFN